MKLLEGKVAIVTGGARGIGKAIAQAFIAEGAKVVIASRTRAEVEATSRELGCLGRVVDVSDPKQARALVTGVAQEHGRLDVLVNNAGTYGPIGPIEELDPLAWKQAIEVNLLGSVYTAQAAIPIFRRQGGGKILNLAGAGVGGPGMKPRISAYSTSKPAIVQLTESLAKELAPTIEVNAIAPGGVVTEITKALIAAGPEKAGRDFWEQNVKSVEKGGDPPELAAKLAVWLASEKSGKLTGKLLSAKWDKVDAIDQDAANRSSLYALRRIDDQLFREVPRA
jgi:NAD(P)-dependent dehydrogenase (short-subunit alcohol dehydrogenase family)